MTKNGFDESDRNCSLLLKTTLSRKRRSYLNFTSFDSRMIFKSLYMKIYPIDQSKS